MKRNVSTGISTRKKKKGKEKGETMEGKKKGLSLTTQILIATAGGIVFGSLIGPWASNLKFIGDIFIRLIQMSVVLLVMTAVAGAVGSGDGQDVGKMGFHTFKWIIFFTLISAGLGVVLSMLIQPGIGIEIANAEAIANASAETASLQDTLLGFVSTNIIGSMADSAMVPCIVFALFFGTAMGTYTRQSGNRNMVEWVTGFNTIITNIIKAVMHVAPIGIFCLLANVAGSTGFKVIIPMIKFLGVLLLGDAIQFLIYGPLTAALCKVNPAKMPKKFAKMSMMAVTTTSGVHEQLRSGPLLCGRNLLYGTVHRSPADHLSNGNGHPAVMSDVHGNYRCTGRFRNRLYLPCLLAGAAAGKYRCPYWY